MSLTSFKKSTFMVATFDSLSLIYNGAKPSIILFHSSSPKRFAPSRGTWTFLTLCPKKKKQTQLLAATPRHTCCCSSCRHGEGRGRQHSCGRVALNRGLLSFGASSHSSLLRHTSKQHFSMRKQHLNSTSRGLADFLTTCAPN